MMSYQEKIKLLKSRFEMDFKKIGYLAGINKKRIFEIESLLSKPTKDEMMRIDRLIKILKMMSKPKSTMDLINEQNSLIKDLGYTISKKIETIDSELKNSVIELIGYLSIESMYFGLLIANNNMDEVILKKLRNKRK